MANDLKDILLIAVLLNAIVAVMMLETTITSENLDVFNSKVDGLLIEQGLRNTNSNSAIYSK